MANELENKQAGAAKEDAAVKPAASTPDTPAADKTAPAKTPSVKGAGAQGETKDTAEKSAAADKPAAPPKKKIDPEQLRLKREAQARASRRRSRQLLGFVLSILVLVGAVSIVIGGINLVDGILNDTSELKEYETRLEPMVWFDVLPFEAPDQIDENILKEVAIWGVLNEKSSSLERNELGEPLVPRLDVDLYAANLFGPSFQFSGHESFIDVENDLRYTYDPNTDMYTVPSTSLLPPYLPVVQEIIRESGGIKRVVVGYITTRGSDDQMIATPDREHPVRYVDYLFRRDGNNYYLYAMQPNTTYVPTQTTSESTGGAAAATDASSLPPLDETLVTTTPAADSAQQDETVQETADAA